MNEFYDKFADEVRLIAEAVLGDELPSQPKLDRLVHEMAKLLTGDGSYYRKLRDERREKMVSRRVLPE